MYIKFNMFFLYLRKVPVGAHEMGIESTKSLMTFVQVAVWQVNKCSRNLCTPQFLSVSWLADSKIPAKISPYLIEKDLPEKKMDVSTSHVPLLVLSR
jgi:hypothetical protein